MERTALFFFNFRPVDISAWKYRQHLHCFGQVCISKIVSHKGRESKEKYVMLLEKGVLLQNTENL